MNKYINEYILSLELCQRRSYQNSPSSIFRCKSSLSEGSISSHSEELHTIKTRSGDWITRMDHGGFIVSCCLWNFFLISSLTCHSRLRSTPPGPRGYVHGSGAPFCPGSSPASHTATGKLEPLTLVIDTWANEVKRSTDLLQASDWVGVALHKLLESNSLHIKGTWDLFWYKDGTLSHRADWIKVVWYFSHYRISQWRSFNRPLGSVPVLTSMEQPSREPLSRALLIILGRSLGALRSSYISETPPVKSSNPSVVLPPDRASYDPFSLTRIH